MVCPLLPGGGVDGLSSLTNNDNSNNGNDGSLLDVCVCCCDGTSMDDSLQQMTMNTAHTGQLRGQHPRIWDNNNGTLAARQSGKATMAPRWHAMIRMRLHLLLAKYDGHNNKQQQIRHTPDDNGDNNDGAPTAQ